MTRAEWVQAALDARVEQGFPVEIEDVEVLDYLADVFANAGEEVDRARTA